MKYMKVDSAHKLLSTVHDQQGCLKSMQDPTSLSPQISFYVTI